MIVHTRFSEILTWYRSPLSLIHSSSQMADAKDGEAKGELERGVYEYLAHIDERVRNAALNQSEVDLIDLYVSEVHKEQTVCDDRFTQQMFDESKAAFEFTRHQQNMSGTESRRKWMKARQELLQSISSEDSEVQNHGARRDVMRQDRAYDAWFHSANARQFVVNEIASADTFRLREYIPPLVDDTSD